MCSGYRVVTSIRHNAVLVDATESFVPNQRCHQRHNEWCSGGVVGGSRVQGAAPRRAAGDDVGTRTVVSLGGDVRWSPNRPRGEISESWLGRGSVCRVLARARGTVLQPCR